MGGLILCSKEKAEHPLYIEELGIHLYCAEELSYVIYNHLFVVQEGFLDHRFLTFLGEDLGYRDLALHLRSRITNPHKTDDCLLEILKEIGYYTGAEISRLKEYMVKYKKMHPAFQLSEKAEYYSARRRFGKALACYEQILREYEEQLADEAFLGEVYSQIAALHARLFEFQKAAQAYEKSYGLLKSREPLKKLYFLTLLEPGIRIREELAGKISSEEQKKWQHHLEEIQMEARESGRVSEFREVLKKDPARRSDKARTVLMKWKEEYRSMM